jgi:hypothetical protein
MAPFGVLFVGNSYPITSDHFAQVDATHWVSVGSSCCSHGNVSSKEASTLEQLRDCLDELNLQCMNRVLLLLLWLHCLPGCVPASMCNRPFQLLAPDAAARSL